MKITASSPIDQTTSERSTTPTDKGKLFPIFMTILKRLKTHWQHSCVQNSIERMFWAGKQSNPQNFEKNDTLYETQGRFHQKKKSKWPPKKTSFSSSANSQYLSQKI